MYKVQTINQIATCGLDRFSPDSFEYGPDVNDPHALILRSHKLQESELGSALRAVARAGAGVNNVPVELCSQRGIVVFNTPGANANSVKELVMTALLLASRDIFGGIQYVQGLSDIQDASELNNLVEKEKKRFKGKELMGKSLGVVGLGAIGSLVARAALDMGMDVLGFDPAISVDAAWRLPSEVQRMENLPALFAKSDYITLHVPFMDATKDLINAESLKGFRKGAVLLNFARQGVVHEVALSQALQANDIAAYFSDFPSTVLAGLPNVFSTPHLGASTNEAEENCAVMAANQLIDFLKNGNIRNSVNFPMVSLERTEGYRLAITNNNVAGMLGQLLSIMAEQNINVIDMLNKSHGDVAYNLLDIDTRPNDQLIAAINNIDSVLNVRVFD